MLALVVQNHPHRAGTDLRGIRWGSLRHRSILSRVGASGKPGAVHVSVKAKINAGPFAPLSARTIEARARRRHPDTGKLANQASNRNARDFLKLQGQGTPDAVLHDAGFAKPLFDTGALYQSVVYVLKDR